MVLISLDGALAICIYIEATGHRMATCYYTYDEHLFYNKHILHIFAAAHIGMLLGTLVALYYWLL